jgi:hypothetical protein
MLAINQIGNKTLGILAKALKIAWVWMKIVIRK